MDVWGTKAKPISNNKPIGLVGAGETGISNGKGHPFLFKPYAAAMSENECCKNSV